MNTRTPTFHIPENTHAEFEHRKLVHIDHCVDAEYFDVLKTELLTLATEGKALDRSYVPAHKKGGTIGFDVLRAKAPLALGLYHSEAMRAALGAIIGATIEPTPLDDMSSMSLLVYERPGDHIDWHYDHNFYRGRHFTVLLPIENRGSLEDGLSHAQLFAKFDGKEVLVDTPPNRLVCFEGAKVLHRATPIKEGERRIVLSMTFSTDPRAPWMLSTARRLKDIAFFGISALWRR